MVKTEYNDPTLLVIILDSLINFVEILYFCSFYMNIVLLILEEMMIKYRRALYKKETICKSLCFVMNDGQLRNQKLDKQTSLFASIENFHALV